MQHHYDTNFFRETTEHIHGLYVSLSTSLHLFISISLSAATKVPYRIYEHLWVGSIHYISHVCRALSIILLVRHTVALWCCSSVSRLVQFSSILTEVSQSQCYAYTMMNALDCENECEEDGKTGTVVPRYHCHPLSYSSILFKIFLLPYLTSC